MLAAIVFLPFGYWLYSHPSLWIWIGMVLPLMVGCAVYAKRIDYDEMSYQIRRSFDAYMEQFHYDSYMAKSRFENRQYHQQVAAAEDRIKSYSRDIGVIAGSIESSLIPSASDRDVWVELKERFKKLISHRYELDLGVTYFYSIMRRVFFLQRINR
jgi:isocitrate dehydrogenase kinase/phosphatase